MHNNNNNSNSTNNHNSTSSYWFSSNSVLTEARRSFFLVTIFDFLFMVLLWLIYCTTKGYSLKEAYEKEIVNYDVDVSLFDLVLLSLLRFILLSVIYVFIKCIHWLPITIITFSTSTFLIAKVLLFALKGTHKEITDYVILIISFVLVWIQVWYLEVKIFSPGRNRTIESATQPSEARMGYGSTNRRAISDIVSFYSPLDSPNDSDNEDQQQSKNRNIPSINSAALMADYSNLSFNSQSKEYEALSKDLIQKVLDICNKTEGWKLDKQFTNDNNQSNSIYNLTCIYTQTFSKIGKVFKLESYIHHNENSILRVLRDDVLDYSIWNKSVKETQVLARYADNLSIVYSLVHEQVSGLVASRDFVNLTKYAKVNDTHVLAGVCCTHVSKPPVEGIVRGENGPTAYIIKSIDNQLCKITWILNVNLKGWLPQYLIDQSLSTVQIDFIGSLTDRLNQLKNNIA